ncbi:prostatic acid phosphatase [Culicoides brevitarsis]|uniref:prostatic acid phosphatase n=1 Tax=Culicoides brevitarsis TaxID=469753 RepID=UPI00307B7C69
MALMCLKGVLLLLICIQISAGNEVLDKGKLVFSHIIYRHGDRTPIEPYPNDPYRDASEWPTGWGQLTNLGKQQHYELGKWLRQRYNSLLNETYSKNEIYVRSTDVDRTLMSAQANLAGLYPPKGKDIWNDEVAWQPIPVHTVQEKHDKVLAAKKSCPAYDYGLRKLRDSDEYRKINEKNKALYDYVTEKSGRRIVNMEGIQFMYSVLNIEQIYNKTLPEWTKAVFPDKMKPISGRSFATYTYTRPLARLKSGPLLKEMLERFTNKTHKRLSPDRKVWMYSAHDTTVGNILNTLKVFEYHSPPYRACVMLELREYQNEAFVSVFYKNTSAEPQLMDLPGCGVACPLEKMYKLYADVLPENWEAECNNVPVEGTQFLVDSLHFDPAMAGGLQTTLIVIVSAVVIMCVVLLILGAMILYRRRGYHDEDKWYYRIDG